MSVSMTVVSIRSLRHRTGYLVLDRLYRQRR